MRFALLSLFILFQPAVWGDIALPPKPTPIYPLRYPITGWNFDWDDNIFTMPTQIRIWNRTTGEEIGVSTAKYALIKKLIGKPGEWENFESRKSLITGSLRYFGDESEKPNVFLEDILKALQLPPDQWQGPSWASFVKAMSHSATASQTTIITARMHSPDTIYAALKELRRLKYIRHVPLRRNIFPVGYPKLDPRFRADPSDPSAAKAVVMASLLDKLQAIPVSKNSPYVVNREGTDWQQMHLWGFSDDDYDNYAKAISALSAKIDHWPNIKITVFFTGKNNPKESARVEVLTPNGGKRLILPDEKAYQRVLANSCPAQLAP